MGRQLLQSDRNAVLFIDVLRSYVASKKFRVHDFVVMPDHVHWLLTLDQNITIERAMQFIKGGFSYRLKRETGYSGEIWQPGFSEVRVEDEGSFEQHVSYIAENPVKAGLANSRDEYPFCFRYLARKKQQGLKPKSSGTACGTAEAVPWYKV